MATTFSPTPIPEPANPPPQPQPQPPPEPAILRGADADAKRHGRRDYSVAWLEAFLDYNLLRFTQRAFGILASHGVSEDGPFPLICAACQKPWCCPEVVWAADWILKAKQRGLLEAYNLDLSDDVLAIVTAWGKEAAKPAEADAAYVNG